MVQLLLHFCSEVFSFEASDYNEVRARLPQPDADRSFLS